MTEDNVDDNPAIRIQRIKTTGLFGALDHEIVLRRDERVTVLCGPNGVGKTRLLECTRALCGGNLLRLMQVPFETFVVELADGSGVVVTRTELPEDVAAQRLYGSSIFHSTERWITLSPLGKKKLGKPWTPSPQELLLDMKRKRVRHQHLFPGMWVDGEGNVWDANERPFISEEPDKSQQGPDWLREFVQRTNVRLLDTQRLGHPGLGAVLGSSAQLEVERLANDAAHRMRTVRDRYAAAAASLDGTYIKRFMAYDDSHHGSHLESKLADIEARCANLDALALLPADNSETTKLPNKLGANKRPALALYVEDMDRKLSELEPFAEQLELFLSSVNRRLLGKRVVPDATNGLMVKTKKANLAHGMLSAGEQHLLVLIYHLIFEVPSNALVLIDEPELSQHRTWQEVFLADLLRIVDYRNFDVLLATHSTHIIGERTDLCATLSNEPRTSVRRLAGRRAG
jgi:energy-coupling factor transporter ATP-binding protein EcfA2